MIQTEKRRRCRCTSGDYESVKANLLRAIVHQVDGNGSIDVVKISSRAMDKTEAAFRIVLKCLGNAHEELFSW